MRWLLVAIVFVGCADEDPCPNGAYCVQQTCGPCSHIGKSCVQFEGSVVCECDNQWHSYPDTGGGSGYSCASLADGTCACSGPPDLSVPMDMTLLACAQVLACFRDAAAEKSDFGTCESWATTNTIFGAIVDCAFKWCSAKDDMGPGQCVPSSSGPGIDPPGTPFGTCAQCVRSALSSVADRPCDGDAGASCLFPASCMSALKACSMDK